MAVVFKETLKLYNVRMTVVERHMYLNLTKELSLGTLPFDVILFYHFGREHLPRLGLLKLVALCKATLAKIDALQVLANSSDLKSCTIIARFLDDGAYTGKCFRVAY